MYSRIKRNIKELEEILKNDDKEKLSEFFKTQTEMCTIYKDIKLSLKNLEGDWKKNIEKAIKKLKMVDDSDF